MLEQNERLDDIPVSHKKTGVSPVVVFLVLAGGLLAGYLFGTYRFQFIGIIGNLFGQKTHSTNIDLSSVQETYNKLLVNYDGEVDTQELIYGANRGLVEAAGDEYTQYMSPEEADEFKDSLNGNIGAGIGAEIGKRNDQLIIIRTLKNNSAEKAGLKASDIILKVNDEITLGWSVEKTVGLIRGDKGTTVKLTILRSDEVRDFTITRDTIDNPSVDSKVVGDVGVMTVYRFDGQTGELAKVAAQGFIKQSVKGVVVDLRNNGGGYVSAAKELASLWLDNKVLLVEKKGLTIRDTVKTSGYKAILADLPTVVLVNNGSASASEIFAGALQEYDIAEVVGEKTFGKGSVQLPLDLSDGSLIKVTIAKWYTPNGKNINDQGINPDVEVQLSEQDFNDGKDPQLDKSIELLNL